MKCAMQILIQPTKDRRGLAKCAKCGREMTHVQTEPWRIHAKCRRPDLHCIHSTEIIISTILCDQCGHQKGQEVPVLACKCPEQKRPGCTPTTFRKDQHTKWDRPQVCSMCPYYEDANGPLSEELKREWLSIIPIDK